MITKFFDRLFPTQQLGSNEARFWPGLFGATTKATSGVVVTPGTAMRQTTANACVRLLAETMAQLPVTVYERSRSGSRLVATNYPLSKLIGGTPNNRQDWFGFVEMLQGHLALRGNAYAFKIGAPGRFTQLVPIHPDRVRLAVFEDDNSTAYLVKNERGAEETYSAAEVLHIMDMTLDGRSGISRVEYARDAIGMAQAAEGYAGKFFAGGVRPSGILRLPPGTKQGDAEKAQAALVEKYSGPDGWQVPMAVWGAMEWQDLGMTNKDAEFLESMKRSDTEICKIWRVQPHMVGILDKATNNNIEQQSLEFVLYTMLPIVRRWESAFNRQLLDDPARYYVKFNLRGLLRGDSASRSEYYAKMITNALMSPNEVRELEDLDPYEGGDNFFLQGAMVPVSKLLAPAENEPGDTADMSHKLGQMLGLVEVLKAENESLARRIETQPKRTAQPRLPAPDADQAADQARKLAAQVEALKQQRQDALQTNALILRETSLKILRIESERAIGAARKPNFLSAVESAYADLSPKFIEMLEPAVWQRQLLGEPIGKPDEIVARHVERSKELLLNAAECQPAGLRANVERCISTWQERAKEFLTA